MAHAAQLSVARVVLVLALNKPGSQAAHERSLLAVAATVVRKPGAHGALTAAHAAPSLAPENVEPTTQAAHWRSAVAEPAADWPAPTAHVVHTVQLSEASVVLVVALKEPNAHSTHVRPLLAEAATAVRKPGPHGALTATHGASLFTSEYVEPATQALHLRSAVLEPGADWPWPSGHMDHAVQLSLFRVPALVLAL